MSSDSTRSVVEKARELAEKKISRIDDLQREAEAVQRYRDGYDAALAEGWSREELTALGFEALQVTKRKTASKNRGRNATAAGKTSERASAGAPQHGEGDPVSHSGEHADQSDHDQFAPV